MKIVVISALLFDTCSSCLSLENLVKTGAVNELRLSVTLIFFG